MNRKSLLLTCIIAFYCSTASIGIEIACDSDAYSDDPSCLLTEAVINASDFTISGLEDDTVRLFDVSRNRKVEFLPIRISDKFPNLVSYAADRCSIREISKANFENLFHLSKLNLIGNRLEIIKTDTFEDLVSLEFVLLAGNKIKAMQSGLLHRSQSLKHVNLMSNICINKNFSKELSSMDFFNELEFFSEIDENCETTEIEPTCEVIEKCTVGLKCCQLSKFESASPLLLKLEGYKKFDAISYNSNPNVKYLLASNKGLFEDTKAYDASNCAVREIFHINFEWCLQLQSINLANNQISKLVRRSMSYTMPLKYLNLTNNRIKFLASELFTDFFSSLEAVDLTSNICIDEKFSGYAEIQKMISKIESNCRFERPESSANELICEEIKRCDSGVCCDLGTDITLPEFTIVSADYRKIHLLSIRGTGINFIPVSNNFIRNLIRYEVRNTSVKTIGKENFDGMIWLESLQINFNSIETIPRDAFQGLLRLKDIDLSHNKIKAMKGWVFENLPALEMVDLTDNECINQVFEKPEDVRGLPKTVNKTCGIDRAEIQITCEDLSQRRIWISNLDEANVCEMRRYTVINDLGYTILNLFNTKVKTLDFSDNENVEFLPISPDQNFPNLEEYNAARCAIREISKENFENLLHLNHINLRDNKIYGVLSDTFEGLESLLSLDLSYNKIKFINGQVFKSFTYKLSAYLDGNDCMFSAHSSSSTQRAYVTKEFLSEVSKKCGFKEIAVKKNQIGCLKSDCVGQKKAICCSFDSDVSVINFPDFFISDRRHDGVTDINYNQNPEIQFLPVLVFLKFSNVLTYNADRCSVKEISKKNFDHLQKLENLNLAFNRIATIKHDTFERLKNLKKISLNNNPILSMNGRVFEGLQVLNIVSLAQSGCINENFTGSDRILGLSNTVTERCGFPEVGNADFKKIFDNCSSVPYAKGYIVGGKQTDPGQWPFLAAIIYKPTHQFFCGGNLITDRHVLTAAHCVHNKHQTKLRAADILVLLGHRSLENLTEPHSKTFDVENIFIHDSWSPSDVKYDADLAVLALDKNVEFSPFIQPVCVTDDIEILQLEDGYVVGWGKRDSSADHEDIPRQALIRAVNDSYCFQNDPALGQIYSHRAFCAKGQGEGPCSGDSGGGFYVKFGGLWTLRGIVSAGPTDSIGECEINRFTLYTKLTYFTTWIENAILKKKYLRRPEFN